RDVARKLVIETMIGSALMLKETGKHPGVLRDMVTSPGGTTIAALKAFEEGGLRKAAFEAVEDAVRRAEQLGG
ncbi:MAG: pyrroline-5-carboxylate reductase, partial [Actinomycetia bacterium]|nr:pyrroline-5-carboxylate reductase [Actinomycetes bacterium]